MTYIRNECVTTRKPHRCWGCCESIPAGSQARVCVNRDGGLVTSYWCRACDDYIDAVRKTDPWYGEDGFMRGEIRDHKHEAAMWEAREKAKNGGTNG